jgi:hypothetical protein
MTDSNQFFRNKINNIKLKKDIISSINSWKNKIYVKGHYKFELLEILEITKEEASNKFDISEELKELNLKFYELKTSKIGSYQVYMILILNDNAIVRIFY